MTLKVSVVVPVYNPGPHIEDCIASLLRQSLPRDEFEVFFVDDGSTDETPARLDALAAEHPHIHVVHQEPSGWSGRPRNVGIDASSGEYVQFVDNDDFLGDEALERMYAYARKNGADVLVGKMAGRGRSVPRELFRKNRPNATLADSQLVDSLTPHKMFRRAFLDEKGIRFKEGRRRLEDHVFVIEAYLRSARTCVLSDYVCYYHVTRDDVSNAAFRRTEPAGYLANLEEALDLVDRYLEPGPVRDKTLRRWLRVEMVERFRAARLLNGTPAEDRQEWFDRIGRIIRERFGPGVAAGLPPVQRAVAGVLAEGRVEELVAFAEWERTLRVAPRLETAEWDGEALRVAFRAELRAGEEPVRFRREQPVPAGAAGEGPGGNGPNGPNGPNNGNGGNGGNGSAEAAAAAQETADGGRDTLVLPGLVPERRRVDITRRLAKNTKVELLVRCRETGAEHYVPVKFAVDREPAATEGDPEAVAVILRGTAAVDPRQAASGSPLETGTWDVSVRLHEAGWTKDARLGRSREPAAREALPGWITADGPLTLDLAHRPAPGDPDPVVPPEARRKQPDPKPGSRTPGSKPAPTLARRVRRRLGRVARRLGLR